MFKPQNTSNNLELIKKQLSEIHTINGSDKTNHKAKYYSKNPSIEKNLSNSPVKSNQNFLRNKAISFKHEHEKQETLKDKRNTQIEKKHNDQTNESVEMEEIAALKLKISKLKKSIKEEMNWFDRLKHQDICLPKTVLISFMVLCGCSIMLADSGWLIFTYLCRVP